MIPRELNQKLAQLAEKFPVVSVTGPRQSGKTTLLQNSFPDYQYYSLEDPDIRLFAQNDPRNFLAAGSHIIIDEIQRVPELFSYIQTITDQSKIPGQFIISGSQSFLLNEKISQSLAGRVAILHLLPFSFTELKKAGISFSSYEDLLFKGYYPRIYDMEIDPGDFYPNYLQTYIERDVRLLQNIQDLDQFIRFMKLAAGRTGQLLNLTSLASDTGISVNTVKSWLTVLEASFIIFLLQPYHKNYNKRLVKMPKLYFYDTGLVSSLLDIQSANQIKSHYLLGGLFENFVIAEIVKSRYHRGLRSNCYFWRDHKGREIDCILNDGTNLLPVEMKAAKTFSTEFFANIFFLKQITDEVGDAYVVFGGDQALDTKAGKLIGWRDIDQLLNRL